MRWALSAALGVLLLVGCTGESEPEETAPTPAEDDLVEEPDLLVGLLRPEHGPHVAAGQAIGEGLELFLGEADGRLGGLAVEVVAADEGGDPEAAVAAAEGLVDDGVGVVVGLVDPAVADDVVAEVDWGEVPLVIAGAAADRLTQPGADGVHRVAPTASQNAMPFGAHACEELGFRQVALVASDDAAGWDAAGGFARTLTDAGCEVTEELFVPVGEEDWASFVIDLADDDEADAVWAPVAGPDALRFLQAYRDVGPEAPLLGGAGLTDEGVLLQQQALAGGVRTAGHYAATLEHDANVDFAAAFEAEHGRSPGQHAEAGYVAGQVVDAALDLAGGEAERLAEALGDVVVDAPRGRLAFDGDGQAVHDVRLREVEEVAGRWQHAVLSTWEEVDQYGPYDRDAYLDMTPYEELVDTWALD